MFTSTLTGVPPGEFHSEQPGVRKVNARYYRQQGDHEVNCHHVPPVTHGGILDYRISSISYPYSRPLLISGSSAP